MAFDVASFQRMLLDKVDLKVVKILVETLQLPMPPVFHLAFYDEPEYIVGEAISRYGGFDRSEQLSRLALSAIGKLL